MPKPAAPRSLALNEADFKKAVRVLSARDPRLAAIIRHAGPCRLSLSRTRTPFVAMVKALVSQQLSGKAAATIYGRVVDLVGGPDGMDPRALLGVDRTRLRAAGLSNAKVSYLIDLSEHIVDGRLDLHDLEVRDDEFVIEAITKVKGFGRWSAEMFLMFRLNRPDIFPLGDLGIVKGVQLFLGMKSKPSERTMLRTAEAWRPYRSIAAWYLWRALDAPVAVLPPVVRSKSAATPRR